MSETPKLLQALLAGLFTWGVTALGACIVFCTKRVSGGVLDRMLGAAAGVMLASCFWSLLTPGLSLAEEVYASAWLLPALGVALGAVVMVLGDRAAHRLHGDCETGRRRCALLITSITLHNIPEGLAVGVAFGALTAGSDAAAVTGAWMLAFGIGLQNFPEGAAVSLPLRREGVSAGRAFFVGQASGLVEPVSAVLGALLATLMREALPFLLCFAAGAMLWVLLRELIPESLAHESKTAVTAWTMGGFLLMMILDVALG